MDILKLFLIVLFISHSAISRSIPETKDKTSLLYLLGNVRYGQKGARSSQADKGFPTVDIISSTEDDIKSEITSDETPDMSMHAEVQADTNKAAFPVFSKQAEGTRVPRSSGSRSKALADYYRKAGISGTVSHVAKRLTRLNFSVDRQRFSQVDILRAELQVYKLTVKSLEFLNRQKSKKRVVRKARVSIRQVTKEAGMLSETKILDSRKIQIERSGWLRFDISQAIKEWIQDPATNKGLEVWVESISAGKTAARVARKTRFSLADSKRVNQRPSLLIYTSPRN